MTRIPSEQKTDAIAAETIGLSVTYDKAQALKNVDITMLEGRITVICGANGSGKSTLLKCLAGLETPTSGKVYLSGKSLNALNRRSVARQVAVMSQTPEIPASLTVEELVEQGRYPHRQWLGRLTERDREIIETAISRVDLHKLRGRQLTTLSGGERQRAWLAMALAQEPRILFLDEPTSFLDIRHQAELLTLLRKLNADERLTIIAILHDLNQVTDISDDVVLMYKGEVLAAGPADRVLQADLLRDAFECKVDIVPHPDGSGRTYCMVDWIGAATPRARSASQ
ncbi:ABC transporter ATP-binding protein [Agrobacterium rosae]|uniref:ABC transporter ATP-binding protein n=1 Tax=Agrobacterium rosae TaxID=1972867 RepID=A0ABU4W5F5_9HYPH|nr:ABC transporter ATP-binding protein [Agrobacterium rosae]MDX8333018.1 ABC transporter ATP-binding protein [Agrobacterium rosae]